MEVTMNGWSMAACIWGLVCLAAYLLKITNKWVYAYRIHRGRKQMNEWLGYIGGGLDRAWEEKPYSKTAIKNWLAEMSASYFKHAIKKHEE